MELTFASSLQRSRRVVAAAVVAAGLVTGAPAAADTCRPIDSLPIVLDEPGLYCLTRDFELDMVGGAAIEVRADRVTVDLQGHLVDNTRAWGNDAVGVFAWERTHVVVRNGSLAGFREGVALSGPAGNSTSAFHLVEGMRISRSTRSAVGIEGRDSIIRGNTILEVLSLNQKERAQGILAGGWRHRVIDNDIAVVNGSVLPDVGILFSGGEHHIATGNRVSGADVAISFDGGRGLYRDNLAVEIPCCASAFQGGTDLGGNHDL